MQDEARDSPSVQDEAGDDLLHGLLGGSGLGCRGRGGEGGVEGGEVLVYGGQGGGGGKPCKKTILL